MPPTQAQAPRAGTAPRTLLKRTYTQHDPLLPGQVAAAHGTKTERFAPYGPTDPTDVARDKDASQQKFTNVITNLAAALIDRMQAAQGSMKAELKHGREVEYRALQQQVTKLAAAQVKAEGEHAETIERLRSSVQAKVHQLEESLDLLDQSITRLESRQRRADQAVIMWSDSNTFAATTKNDCEILRDDFVVVFQGRRR